MLIEALGDGRCRHVTSFMPRLVPVVGRPIQIINNLRVYQRITGLKTGHHRRESRLIVDHREPLPIIRPRYRRQPNFYHTARRPIEHITAS